MSQNIPQQAIHAFPSGIDTYFSVANINTIVSGEAHTVPSVAPYNFYLNHIPASAPLPTTSPSLTYTSGTPSAGTYNVQFSGTTAGLVTVYSNLANSGVSFTYTGAGDPIVASLFNDPQQSITTIEQYILQTIPASGSWFPTSGGSITGQVILSGASIYNYASGVDNLGSGALPFNNIFANEFIGSVIQSSANNSIQFSGNQLIETASQILLNTTNGLYLAAPGSTIYLNGQTISVSGNIIPLYNGLINLGSSGSTFGTIYANNIVTPNGGGPFVAISGSTMTGPLTMNIGIPINVDIISSPNFLNLNAASYILLSSETIYLGTGGGFDQTIIEENLTVTSNNITANSNIIPAMPNSYDLGASGNNFRNLYVDNIVGANLSGVFVHSSGDTMTGNLVISPPAQLQVNTITDIYGSGVTLSATEINLTTPSQVLFTVNGNNLLEVGASEIYNGASIIPMISGTYNLGAPGEYIGVLYANQVITNALTNPVISGNIIIGASGVTTIGSPSDPVSVLYVDSIITHSTSGTYVNKFGDTMTGNLTFASGNGILTTTSGISNIGSAGNPFGAIYANSIVTPTSGSFYVRKTGDTMTGPLTLNAINTPSGNLTVSGTSQTNILAFTTINETAQNINLSATAGSIVNNSTSEFQVLIGSNPTLAINSTEIEVYENIIPNASGTLTLGTQSDPWQAIYANNIYGPSGSTGVGGPFSSTLSGIAIWADTTGNLIANSAWTISGNNLLPMNSGSQNLGSVLFPLSGINTNTITTTFPQAQEDPFYRYNQQSLLHWTNNFSSTTISGIIAGSANALNYGTWDGENFWIGGYTTPSISKINQFGNVTTYNIPSGQPLQLAWDNRYVWIGSADVSGTLIKFDPITNTVVNQYTLNPSGIGAGGIQGLNYDGQYLWAGIAQVGGGAGSGLILQVAPSGGNILMTVSGQTNVNGIAISDLVTSAGSQRYIWAANQGFISKINATNGSYQMFNTGGSTTYRICNDDTCIYGVDFGAGNLQKYSMFNLQQQYFVSTVLNPNSVAFDGKYIWVAGGGTVYGYPGEIAIHDRNTGSIVAQINVGNNLNGLVFDGTYMWCIDANGNYFKTATNDNLGNLKIYESMMVMTSGNIPAFQMSTKQNALIMNGNSISGSNSIYSNSFYANTVVTANSLNLTANNSNILTTQTSGITIGLPSGTTLGKEYRILSTVSSASNTVTISGINCNINSSGSFALHSATLGTSAILVSDGSNYWSFNNIV